MRKTICLILAAVMLLCSAVVPAGVFAAETETYRYVAIGDSIAAGYSLTEAELDPTFLLSEDLIANPIKAAYPAVFGELLSGLGKSKGVKTESFNLSTSGYRASNVKKVLLEKGYINDTYEEFMAGVFGAEVVREKLSNYHDLITGYLKDADLVSVHLGANDIIYGAFDVLAKEENALIEILSATGYLFLLGTDTSVVLEQVRASLREQSDRITVQNYIDAARLFGELVGSMDDLAVTAAKEVGEVVSALKSVNDHADIAVVGMYNPYGNSLVYEGRVRDLRTIVTAVFADAADILIDRFGGAILEAAERPTGETPAGAENGESDPQESSRIISEAIKELRKTAAKLLKGVSTKTILEDARRLLYTIAEQVSYPLQYMLMGKNTEPTMKLLNEKLRGIARTAGAVFVDIYNISNKKDFDPHPTAKGHEEIANILYATLSGKVGEEMTKRVETPVLDRKTASLYTGTTLQLKASTEVTWKSSNKKVAEVSPDGLVTAKSIGKATITAAARNGRTVSCKVTVSCKYVWQCEKDGVYRYTTGTSTVKKLKNSGWTCKKVFRAPGAGKKIYWLYDKSSKRYRYTTNLAYAKQMKKAGNKAGFAFYSSSKKTAPVYEYRKGAKTVTYCYASTAAARKELKAAGFIENGIVWYAEPKAA